jgi:hypothetical protein
MLTLSAREAQVLVLIAYANVEGLGNLRAENDEIYNIIDQLIESLEAADIPELAGTNSSAGYVR